MTVASHHPRTRVAAAAGAAAVALAVGATGCGEAKPAQSAVQAKLKTVSDFSTFDDATLGCIAGVLEKYGTAGSLKKFLSSGNPDDIKGKRSDESNVDKESQACVTNDRK